MSSASSILEMRVTLSSKPVFQEWQTPRMAFASSFPDATMDSSSSGSSPQRTYVYRFCGFLMVNERGQGDGVLPSLA